MRYYITKPTPNPSQEGNPVPINLYGQDVRKRNIQDPFACKGIISAIFPFLEGYHFRNIPLFGGVRGG